MRIKNDKEKNSFFIQDISGNNKSFSHKIFKYFYLLFQEKKEYKLFLKYFLIFIETIQLISYSFSSNHFNSWKMKQNNIIIISNIMNAFRISFFMTFLKYKIYTVILYLLVIIIFFLCLTVILNILFIDSSSKIHHFSIVIICKLFDIIVIIFYIPITEIILIPIKCANGKVVGFNDGEQCWVNIHYINITLGILGTLFLFIWCIFMMFFSFFPFQNSMSAIRTSSRNDVLIIIMKLFLIIQNLLITNEYISITLLLFISMAIFSSCYVENTYNNSRLEIALNMRNLLAIWTNCILLLSKVFHNFLANGFIYLLVCGCPIVIYLSIIIYRERDILRIKIIGNPLTENDYINKAKTNIKLINAFIERNSSIRNGSENEGQRDLIVLKGNIKAHYIHCIEKDCPLTKFVNNEGNFNVQKQCLLNYMNNFFNKGLKLYPNCFNLIILFIHFNYSKKFNMNSVRTNLLQLKKINCNIKEEYVIYCIDQNIKNSKGDGFDINIDNEQDNNSQMDYIEQKYQKLKYLIENSIKLFGEFWGIFSTNISSNINTTKLYSLGEKLNIYLNEMNNLWDNELKNKKIGNECQSIIQLYSKFLLEILWDQKKSKEVYKKINDENLNNYYQNENKKAKEGNNNAANIDELIDNQNYILFCDCDEKGSCKINQSSASFAHSLGYQKIDIIGKPLDLIIPNFLMEELCKYLEEIIIISHNGQNNQNELTYQDNDSNKNSKIIIVKSRMGYIFPFSASFTVMDDNDYSDSLLVKIKMENNQPKSEYAYYILTNTDFVIENISSSAINLGLFLDLLKKYVVKMDILIRTDNDNNINLFEKYNEYEEEAKVITWVFPEIIYPKDNIQKKKEDEIEKLIEKSRKKKYNLLMKVLKFNTNNNIGYIFKLTEVSSKNEKKKKFNNELYIPKCDKKIIMFDLLYLRYFRTLLVDKKSGLRNYRNPEQEKEKIINENTKLEIKKNNKKAKKSLAIEEDDDYYSENSNKNGILLTKEKILELQVHNYVEIRNFIYSLPLYGSDVALERFRPNGDKYSASKITESLIKINISHFCKRMDERIRKENLKNKKNNIINNNTNNSVLESPKSTNNNSFLPKKPPSQELSNVSSNLHNEGMNKGLSSDSSSTLANIFKANTIRNIKILINFTFIATLVMIIAEFLLTYNHLNKLVLKFEFLQNSYKILNNMLYTKHFITEGVLANTLKDYYKPKNYLGDHFLKSISNQLAINRQEFTEIYDTFTSNQLCKEYKDYMEKTKINLDTITVNTEENVELLLNSAMTRISSSINDLASNPSLMYMGNRNTYELMHNLLNEYYIHWGEIIQILFNDSIKATQFYIPSLATVILYFIISIIVIIVFLKLLSQFSLDREKPINLFLTLKKVVFENLKNSAENFSNKLLNKFFGNEDVEEESQQDYQSNIQPSDINIAKFKAANEYNSSITKGFSFMNIVLVIIIFLPLNFIYFIFKYVDLRDRMGKINKFILLYDKTFTSQTDFILSIDIFKSYLFNKSIPILNKDDTNNEFIDTSLDISNKLEDSLIIISQMTSFLCEEHAAQFKQYLLNDFTDLLNKDLSKEYIIITERYMAYGLIPIETVIFEIIRYYTLNYQTLSNNNTNNIDNNQISKLLKYDDDKLLKLNYLNEEVSRKWYKGVDLILIDSFKEFEDESKLNYIIFFICLLVFVIVYYCIFWKMSEEKLNVLLKSSADLINLIPQEIKNIIIEKLNE